MKTTLVLFALLSLGTVGFVSGNAPIVQLTSGKVRGVVQQSDDGSEVYLYQGIRYGRANRFAKPKPAEPWTEVYNATKWRDACPQMGISKAVPGTPAIQTETMSEDCLFLNVWRPAQERTNRTVMVFIHGGGFTIGTIFTFFLDGKYMASRGDVVLVALNYRVGAFGYLYGDTADTPGNLGYHDQILALHWVRDNIGHFGGDPEQVTIFGESAGGYSVGSLIISPLAKGLFKRAIMQSGAPNSITGGITRDKAHSNAKGLARHLKCPLDNTEEMITCLRHKPMMDIVNYTVLDYNKTDNYFTPIYGDQVLPVAPVEALKSGKFNRDIDLLYGVTQDEGSMFALNMFPSYAFTTTNLTIDSTKRDIVHLNEIYKQTFGEEVAQFYIDQLHNPTQDDLKIAVSNAFGDCHIVCPTILFGEQVANYSTQAHYFSYRLTQHLPIAGLPHYPWMGVMHSEDIFYLFALSLLSKPEDQQLGHQMIDAWTNFAKTGNPSVNSWSKALAKSIEGHRFTSYFPLNVHDRRMVDGHYAKVCNAFWSSHITQ